MRCYWFVGLRADGRGRLAEHLTEAQTEAWARGDVRILPWDFARGGGTRDRQYLRQWRELGHWWLVVDVDDRPVPAPGPSEWCLLLYIHPIRGFQDWPQAWVALPLFQRSYWGTGPNLLARSVVALTCSPEGVDIGNLAAFRDAVWQAQLAEYAYQQETTDGAR